MQGTQTELVTPADHEAGFKEIEVHFRSGKSPEKIIIHAPTRRQARGLTFEIAREEDFWPVVKACLNPDRNIEQPTTNTEHRIFEESFLDSLTPQSADEVEMICLAITFGNDFQKKIQTLAIKEATGLMKPVAKS